MRSSFSTADRTKLAARSWAKLRLAAAMRASVRYASIRTSVGCSCLLNSGRVESAFLSVVQRLQQRISAPIGPPADLCRPTMPFFSSRLAAPPMNAHQDPTQVRHAAPGCLTTPHGAIS